MANSFEVGKTYNAYQKEFGTITVLKRSEKSIWVRNNTGIEWRMRIKKDNLGNEFAVDSLVPRKWRDAFTYTADDEATPTSL